MFERFYYCAGQIGEFVFKFRGVGEPRNAEIVDMTECVEMIVRDCRPIVLGAGRAGVVFAAMLKNISPYIRFYDVNAMHVFGAVGDECERVEILTHKNRVRDVLAQVIVGVAAALQHIYHDGGIDMMRNIKRVFGPVPACPGILVFSPIRLGDVCEIIDVYVAAVELVSVAFVGERQLHGRVPNRAIVIDQPELEIAPGRRRLTPFCIRRK